MNEPIRCYEPFRRIVKMPTDQLADMADTHLSQIYLVYGFVHYWCTLQITSFTVSPAGCTQSRKLFSDSKISKFGLLKSPFSLSKKCSKMPILKDGLQWYIQGSSKSHVSCTTVKPFVSLWEYLVVLICFPS